MITLILRRQVYTEKQTIGKLYVDYHKALPPIYICDVLEDKYRGQKKEDKIWGQTAIPYGTYRLRNIFSKKMNYICPVLFDVPNFSGVMIHKGNTEADTLGCLLIGTFNGKQLAPGSSTKAFNSLMSIVGSIKGYYEIKIINE